VFVEEGVVHYCVANMPGAYARTATQALAHATYRYVQLIADAGLDEACEQMPQLRTAVNIRDGKVVHPAVAKAFEI